MSALEGFTIGGQTQPKSTPTAPTTPAPATGNTLKGFTVNTSATPAPTPESNPKGLPTLDSLVKNTAPVNLGGLFPTTTSKVVKGVPGLELDLKDTVAAQEKHLTDLGNKITTEKDKVDTTDEKAVNAFNASIDEYNKVFDSYTQNKTDLGEKDNASTLTKHPVVAALTGGKTLAKFGSDIFGGLPDASKKVSDFINRPLTEASNFLSNTKGVQGMVRNIDSSTGYERFSNQVAIQTIQKLGDVFSIPRYIEGATAGLYKAPETGQKNDIVDDVLQALPKALGMITGFKGISALLPDVGVTRGLTQLVGRYPRIAKYLTPFIKDAVEMAGGMGVQTQLNPNLGGDIKQRIKVLATTIAEVPIYAALGGIKSTKISVPASFTLGFGMTKLSGGSNKDAIASGFTFAILDGMGRADGSGRGFTQEEIHSKISKEALDILNQYATDVKLTEKSTPEQIKAVYNTAVHQEHPDLGGDGTQYESVKNAYDYLSKGAVSNSKDFKTEEEHSAEEIHNEVKGVVDTHGADVAREGLKESVGVDQRTADRLVQGATTKELRTNPEAVAERTLNEVRPAPKPVAERFKANEPKPEKVPTPEEEKTSKVAKSIEAKAIEKGITEKFKDLAGYTPREVKDQIARVTDLIQNRSQDIAPILSGEKPLPEGMSGSMFLTEVENYAHLQEKPGELLQQLASSPLTSETSIHASELRLLAERDPESAVKAIKELAKAKEEAAKKRSKSKNKTKNADGTDTKTVQKEVKESIKKATPSKQTWAEFIESIKC